MARLIAATSDLFLQSRFQELARSLHVEAEIQTTPKLQSTNYNLSLIVLDLASSDYDPFETARILKKNSGVTLFGFYPHVRTDLKRRAEEAGFDHIVTNRELIPRLSSLLQGLVGLGG